ncbi:hydantoinase B/oxoprolinase family protein [Aquibium sp. LZ166]|uniref:Hydantoinase B/oxoprolinase family protein n=1 Tax=Aquibium pacificus TaxID=3153579 RepID=A0ABV3SRZ5_9HYPH
MNMHMPIDAVTVEIIHNALGSVVDESFLALMKSAFSQNIKERRDHSTALADTKGRLVVQAKDSLPIHLGSMMGLMEVLLKRVPLEEMREGDLFVANDPFEAGGTHLPDLNVAMPVFDKGRVVGFVCNIAHHADFGGMTPGLMGGGMTEIYQEGLRVPLVRLYSAGHLNRDIYDLILLNTRVPEERRGDLNAQIAAARLGARRFAEVIGRYGSGTLEAAFGEIIRRTEIRMRHAIGQLPDGIYRFRDVMDDDGCGNRSLPIEVKVTIAGDRLHVDFSGTAAQTAGNINCTPSATLSAISYTIKALLDPEVANNQGVLDVCEWSAPAGSLVNAVFPASVANRAHTCQRIIDALIGALAEAVPDKAVGAGNGANTTAVFTGIDPATGRRYIYFETLGGGFGGRSTHDGKDGVQVHITNTSNLPVEAIEMDYPLRVIEYGLVQDSGGAGTYRGGLAIRRVLSPIGHTCTFSGSGERFDSRPWGIFGGQDGRSGRFMRFEPDGSETELPSKPAGVDFGPGQAIAIETPGAGGYGAPAGRDPALIARDRASGKFSDAFIARCYG